jgi:hypothetical protein
LAVELYTKSPSSKEVVGSEDATLYLSAKEFTPEILVATVVTLVLLFATVVTSDEIPATVVTLLDIPATVPISVPSAATVVTFAIDTCL